MKTTELQKKIIDICISEMRCWQNSNDFMSPTHYNDGETAFYELDYDGELDRESCDEINKKLQRVRITIFEMTNIFK